MKNKRVAVYCRVSTLQEMQDTSFEIQRDAYIQMIASRDGLVLADVYGDHGKSGTSIKHRPEFQRMIHDCEGGKIDIVMTKSISRFARNLRDCLTTIDHLKQLGIPILFEKEGINTMDNKSELLLNILAVIAEEESFRIGQNMRWAYERRNAAGDPFHKTPYGYRRDQKANRWYIHERKARRVRYAFQSAGQGDCYQEILKGLNAMEREEGTGIIWENMVDVVAIVKNKYDNMWVKTSDGYYIYAGYTLENGSYVEEGNMHLQLASNNVTCSISGASLPSGTLEEGKLFSLRGTVNCSNSIQKGSIPNSV